MASSHSFYGKALPRPSLVLDKDFNPLKANPDALVKSAPQDEGTGMLNAVLAAASHRRFLCASEG